jgi:short chain dehydrogenase
MSETPHPRQEPQGGIRGLPAEDKVPGRVAIVTGAARGIGAATARRLAADGMAVAVLDLDAGSCDATVEAITSAGGRAIAVGADVSEDDQVEAAVATVAEEFGPPAVLVNNAGVLRDNLLFPDQDPRHRTRPVRHHRQRGGARLHRHRHDGRDRRPARHDVRGLPGQCGLPGASSPDRRGRGCRARHLLPGQRGCEIHFRPGDLRGGRPTVLNGRGVPSTPVTQPPM